MMEKFQERLRICRKNLRKSQQEVAAETGLVYRTYRRYECGEIEPTLTPLLKLADYFGVSLDYLTGRIDEE